MRGLWRVETGVVGFFALCVVDFLLEFFLILLLRWRHPQLWIEAGSPKASLWSYVQNSLSAREFVMSQSVRGRHDVLLGAYCWVYRIFNVVFIGSMALVAAMLIIAAAQYIFARTWPT